MTVGGEFARREVDEGLYRSRWERATPAQRKRLRAMGELGGDNPVAISDLAATMGKRRVSDLSVARNEVIKKGLLLPRSGASSHSPCRACTPLSPDRTDIFTVYLIVHLVVV